MDDLIGTEKTIDVGIGDQLTAIDELRSSIEQDHRFKSSFFGFNKKEVQEYLNSFSSNFRKAVYDQNEDLKRVEKENKQLYAIIEEQKQKLESVRAEERSKLQAEYDMQEGIVDSLREKNSALQTENEENQIQITALTEQLNRVRSLVEERSNQLETLSNKLEELLMGKMKECGDIIDIWKTEFQDIVQYESSQLPE